MFPIGTSEVQKKAKSKSLFIDIKYMIYVRIVKQQILFDNSRIINFSFFTLHE